MVSVRRQHGSTRDGAWMTNPGDGSIIPTYKLDKMNRHTWILRLVLAQDKRGTPRKKSMPPTTELWLSMGTDRLGGPKFPRHSSEDDRLGFPSRQLSQSSPSSRRWHQAAVSPLGSPEWSQCCRMQGEEVSRVKPEGAEATEKETTSSRRGGSTKKGWKKKKRSWSDLTSDGYAQNLHAQIP